MRAVATTTGSLAPSAALSGGKRCGMQAGSLAGQACGGKKGQRKLLLREAVPALATTANAIVCTDLHELRGALDGEEAVRVLGLAQAVNEDREQRVVVQQLRCMRINVWIKETVSAYTNTHKCMD